MEDRDYKDRTPLQVAAELGKVIIYCITTGKFVCIYITLQLLIIALFTRLLGQSEQFMVNI